MNLLRIHPKDDMPELVGRIVKLEPIRAGDEQPLAIAAYDGVFRFYVTGMPTKFTAEGFADHVHFLIETRSILAFKVTDLSTMAVVGSTSVMDIRPEDAHVEVGMTWYSKEAQGTKINPECKLLLLSYSFEKVGCERVTLKCDARNARSRAGIEKLGAKFEGILRRHRYTQNDEFRDTAYYSILQEEWPAVKVGLKRRLAT